MNSLYGTAVTGMQGADFQLNVVANNIANLNTSGYETVEPIVASLPAQAEIGDPNNGIPIAPTTHVGMGVAPSGTMRSDVQAALEQTGNPLDVAIAGPGYIAVRQPDGTLAYTKQATLQLEPDGRVATTQGLALVPPVRVPAGVQKVSVDAMGHIVGETRNGSTVRVGALTVVGFAAPENLRAQGGGLYAESLGSGRPQQQKVGPATVGETQVMSGYQLKSSVDLATELTNMIAAERMYQVNSKALQTMDSLVNNAVSLQAR